MPGTPIWFLVREDLTYWGATKPMWLNYWTHTLEPRSHNYWAHVPQSLKPRILEPILCSKRSHCNKKLHLPEDAMGSRTWKPLQEEEALQLESSPQSMQLEKACAQQQRPSAAKNK